MGSSLSCLCNTKASKKHVIVITHNGKVLRVKAGTRVKEIIAANPCHTVLRAGPGDSVSALPGSSALGGDGLYFLVPQGQKVSRDMMNNALVKLERSRKFGFPANCNKFANQQVMVLDASSEYKKSQWRPALHTISETTSSLEKSS